MKVLLACMSVMGNQKGPLSKVKAISQGLTHEGHQVALCMGKDANYHQISGVKTYYAPVPSPLGLPRIIGKHAFKIAEILGIRQNRHVNSFEGVLYITGALNLIRNILPKMWPVYGRL